MTAARTMAAADSTSAALRRRDLCSRGIRLAGKMRADVVDLLDAYVSLLCSFLERCWGLGCEDSDPWQGWGTESCWI